MGPDHLDALVVGPVGAQQRLDAQRRRDVGHLDQQADLVDRQRQQHLHRLGAVDQAEPFLRARATSGSSPSSASSSAAGRPVQVLARAAQPALADERLGQVGELAEVAAGADRALAGDHREQVVLEHARAAVAAGRCVRRCSRR